MPFIQLGGHRWSTALVGWGSAGRKADSEMLGYSPRKQGRGALSASDRDARTVNVWSIPVVYALFDERRLVYVGEGSLGTRLRQHYRDDELSGQWDSFSWLSPWTYHAPVGAGGKARVSEDSAAQPTTLQPKSVIELLELTVVRLADPPENRQVPTAAKNITWLQQVRSRHAEASMIELVQSINARLAALEKQSDSRRP